MVSKDFTDQEQDAIDKLVAMDFTLQQSQAAVRAKGTNIDSCIDYIFSDPPSLTETTGYEDQSYPTIDHTAPDLPPLMDIAGSDSGRGLPPSYDGSASNAMSGWDWSDPSGPQLYPQSYNPPPSPHDHGSKSIAPFDSHSSTEVNSASSSIILPPPGQLLLTAAPDDDQDLQRAIYDSQSFPSHKSFVGGHRGLEQATGDDDFDKAMEMSLSMISDAPEEQTQRHTSSDVLFAQDRVRDDLSEPCILRSLSPHLSGLSAYFQCIYAVPVWRSAVLASEPLSIEADRNPSFAGYWNGQLMELSTERNGSDAERRVIALKRLFAMMSLTRRSFVHISEVTQAFDIQVADYMRSGFASDWTTNLGQLHQGLAHDMRDHLEHKLLMTGGPDGPLDSLAIRRMATSFFSLTGRDILADKYIDGPLPALSEQEEFDTAASLLRVDIPHSPTNDYANSLLAHLFKAFLSTPDTLSLIITPPKTIAFEFHRSGVVDIDLTNFGSGMGSAVNKRVYQIPEEIWLDRYSARNRGKIMEGREEMIRLEQEKEAIASKLRKLKVTSDGKDGVELVRNSLGYFKDATSEDVTRAEKQQWLAKEYEKVLSVMELKIAEYEQDIEALQAKHDAVFDNPEMKKIGPYKLCSLLMRNGLNGRGSAWSVVKDDAGKWWKILDLEKIEVTLEEALADKSGLHMDAGLSMAFYAVDIDEPPVLDSLDPLREGILIDNLSFSAELPAQTTEHWNLDIVAVDLTLGLPTPSPEAMEISRAPSEGAVEIDMLTVTPKSEDEFQHIEHSQADVAMDENEDGDLVENEEALLISPVMRLKGGAPEGVVEEADVIDVGPLSLADADDEDYDEDDDGMDEDEVELGCLEPIKEGEAWDVDMAVGKVGGKPVWLDPESPLSFDEVNCGVCGHLMSFLLQVNSPDDERPHASARSLYLYVCPSIECLSKDASKATKFLRIQMPSPNPFYPRTTETIARRKELEAALDSSTALSGSMKEGSRNAVIWPEWDVVCEEEPYEESYISNSEVAQGEASDTEDAAEPDTQSGVDISFLRFQERLARLPEQTLRFYRLPGVEEPEPLWVSSKRVAQADVPKCTLCGSERKIEFQILSTLLSYISAQVDTLDFDTLLLYTCVENCEIPNRTVEGSKCRTGWAEEIVIKQDFAAGGARLQQQAQ